MSKRRKRRKASQSVAILHRVKRRKCRTPLKGVLHATPSTIAMDILSACQNFGLNPKRKTATEWAAACPGCGGKDRFIVEPDYPTGTGGHFWCRVCGVSGDMIDFLQQFGGLTKQEAFEKAGKTKGNLAGGKSLSNSNNPVQKHSFPARQKEPDFPSRKWIEQATAFLSRCQTAKALNCPMAIMKLAERFISSDCACRIGLGYNQRDEYMQRQAWGLTGEGKIRLPSGIVIATRSKIGVISLLIRRVGDENSKYWQIAGGAKDRPYIPKWTPNLPVFVFESALDAALLACEAGDICNAVGLGGTNKAVDDASKDFINSAPLIILSPDNDTEGRNAIPRWQGIFPSAWTYLTTGAKDIGDMQLMSLNNPKIPNARQWSEHVIEYCSANRSHRRI